MHRKPRLTRWSLKADEAPVPVAPPLPEGVLERQMELARQQRFRQFREALSPFWAWRMAHR